MHSLIAHISVHPFCEDAMNILAQAKRPTNVSLPGSLVAEAKGLGINVSEACAQGLAKAVQAAREAEWLRENRVALESSNVWAEANGLPLAKYRQF
jgi:antitoxin CcdA